jgi:hypothetical protein
MNETSAVCELFNFPASDWNKHNIYDIPLKFYEIKQALEPHLSDRTNHLFNLQDSIAIFDLTNSYFEGQKRQIAVWPSLAEARKSVLRPGWLCWLW